MHTPSSVTSGCPQPAQAGPPRSVGSASATVSPAAICSSSRAPQYWHLMPAGVMRLHPGQPTFAAIPTPSAYREFAPYGSGSRSP